MREVSNLFHKLYYDIDNVKKSEDQTNRDLVYFYFWFEKTLSEQLSILLQSYLSQTAYINLNEEIKKKFLKNVNKNMICKRIIKKIYDIFNMIGEDKILYIKSFIIFSFSDIMKSKINYYCVTVM